MIEMLGVLAIIGVLSAGGVWGYNVAITNYWANKIISDVSLTMAAAGTVFTKPINRNNVDALRLKHAGIIHGKCQETVDNSGVCEAGGGVKLIYKYHEEFAGVTATVPDGVVVAPYGYMEVFFLGLKGKKTTCVKLLTHKWGELSRVGISYIIPNYATGRKTTYTVSEAEEICDGLGVRYINSTCKKYFADNYCLNLAVFTFGRKQ